jgi:hypothetical protein
VIEFSESPLLFNITTGDPVPIVNENIVPKLSAVGLGVPFVIAPLIIPVIPFDVFVGIKFIFESDTK